MKTGALHAPLALAASCTLAAAGGDPCPGIAFDDDSQVIEFAVNGSPYSVQAGDIDLDGDLDLLVGVSSWGDADAWLLRNPGDGVFGVPIEVETGSRSENLRFVDVNGDAYPDLVGISAEGVAVRLNDGNGWFLPTDNYEIRFGLGEVEIADLNNDGFLDIVASREQSDGISALLGDGSGAFGSEIFTPGIDSAAGLGLGDLNGDGFPDAVVGMTAVDQVAVALGVGDGSFVIQGFQYGGDFPLSVQVVDFNQDGLNDAVVRQLTAPGISIYLGDGTGALVLSQEHDVSGGITLWTDSIGIGDMDLDGNLDIVTGTIFEGATVLLGRGNGEFLTVRSYGGGGIGASGVVVADLNNDGLPDVASTQNYSPRSVRIVLNECDNLCSVADLARPYGDQGTEDITTFVGLFMGGDPIADVNRDNRLDLGDIAQFVGSYQLGCDPGGNGGD